MTLSREELQKKLDAARKKTDETLKEFIEFQNRFFADMAKVSRNFNPGSANAGGNIYAILSSQDANTLSGFLEPYHALQESPFARLQGNSANQQQRLAEISDVMVQETPTGETVLNPEFDSVIDTLGNAMTNYAEFNKFLTRIRTLPEASNNSVLTSLHGMDAIKPIQTGPRYPLVLKAIEDSLKDQIKITQALLALPNSQQEKTRLESELNTLQEMLRTNSRMMIPVVKKLTAVNNSLSASGGNLVEKTDAGIVVLMQQVETSQSLLSKAFNFSSVFNRSKDHEDVMPARVQTKEHLNQMNKHLKDLRNALKIKEPVERMKNIAAPLANIEGILQQEIDVMNKINKEAIPVNERAQFKNKLSALRNDLKAVKEMMTLNQKAYSEAISQAKTTQVLPVVPKTADSLIAKFAVEVKNKQTQLEKEYQGIKNKNTDLAKNTYHKIEALKKVAKDLSGLENLKTPKLRTIQFNIILKECETNPTLMQRTHPISKLVLGKSDFGILVERTQNMAASIEGKVVDRKQPALDTPQPPSYTRPRR